MPRPFLVVVPLRHRGNRGVVGREHGPCGKILEPRGSFSEETLPYGPVLGIAGLLGFTGVTWRQLTRKRDATLTGIAQALVR